MFRILGIILILLAIAIAVVPAFTDCQSQGLSIALPNGKTVPMKCHWTGVAEIGTAVPLVAIGIMLIASRRKESRIYLNISGIVLGGLAVAFPSGLIGVCATPTMTCVTLMSPALLAMGGVVIALSVFGLVWSLRSKDQ
jgi:hypothetical protein